MAQKIRTVGKRNCLQYAMYRFIFSSGMSSARPSSTFWFGRFMWRFITCLAMICSVPPETHTLDQCQAEGVSQTCLVSRLVMLVLDDEYHIEPRQNRRLEVNILSR